ncbi:hypothetical protein ACQ4M4_13600 [Leptolyngbya sp. AN02str]|uniref:hypothetical protein n=1 Tax=Leptolyngbya sp. AN02str TaxID=3423363 RepID=UPI003D31DC4A
MNPFGDLVLVRVVAHSLIQYLLLESPFGIQIVREAQLWDGRAIAHTATDPEPNAVDRFGRP